METISKELGKELERMTTSPQLPSTISKSTVILQSDRFLESVGQGRRINSLTLGEVKQTLTAFAAIMGIPANNMPAEEVMMMTIQAIVTNFGSMTEGEIRKAFEMAATGQLDIEQHYQSLSLKYICNVLNAYRIKVNMAMRHYERTRQEPESMPFEGEVNWSETVGYLIEQAKKQDPSTLIIPVQVYDWLIHTGEMNPSTEEKKMSMKRAEGEMKQQLLEKLMTHSLTGEERQWNEFLKTSSYKKGDRLQTRLANMAKRIIVRDYLKKHP